MRDTLMAVQGLHGAVHLIAWTVAFTHRMLVHHTHMPEDLVPLRANKLLWDFLMLVRSGVLVSQGVPCESLITQRTLIHTDDAHRQVRVHHLPGDGSSGTGHSALACRT